MIAGGLPKTTPLHPRSCHRAASVRGKVAERNGAAAIPQFAYSFYGKNGIVRSVALRHAGMATVSHDHGCRSYQCCTGDGANGLMAGTSGGFGGVSSPSTI